LLFLYRDVLGQPLDRSIDATRARKPKRLPTVLTKEEAMRVIGYISGPDELMTKLLYGTGLRLMACLRLRVKDIDFSQHQIVVRDGKGMEDRVTMLPASLVVPLQEHLSGVKRLQTQTLAKSYGSVYLPFALERKYPRAGRLWIWQYVFPSHRLSRDPRTATARRHHASESRLQRAVS
jgi:integrase